MRKTFAEFHRCQLHHLCDASARVYAAAPMESYTGQIYCIFSSAMQM